MADWIPKREQDLIDLQAKWTETLSNTTKQTAYGWPAADCTAVTTAIAAFTDARDAYRNVDSTTNRIAKDEAKEASIDAMRDFATAHIRPNKLMSIADKEFLGIGPHDTEPTIHGRPTQQPGTEVLNTENHFEHRVRALYLGEPHKPHGVHGVRFAWQVGGTQPASGEDLPKSRFSRAPSIVVEHGEAHKGQTVYYSTAYENARGEYGPWSQVESAIIG